MAREVLTGAVAGAAKGAVEGAAEAGSKATGIGKADKDTSGSESKSKYRDVPGLCKVASLKEIEAQGWSLNPGRYVGVAPGEAVSDEDFKEYLEELNEDLETPQRASA